MAWIIQKLGDAIYNKQEFTSFDQVKELKVIFKYIPDDKGSIFHYKDLTDFLHLLIYEPVVFIVMEKDYASIECLNNLGYYYSIASLDEIHKLNTNNTFAVFVIKSVKKNTRKIIEIICNKVFKFSVLLI